MLIFKQLIDIKRHKSIKKIKISYHLNFTFIQATKLLKIVDYEVLPFLIFYTKIFTESIIKLHKEYFLKNLVL